MNLNIGNTNEGKKNPNMSLFNERVMSLKLKGVSDRAAAKKLKVAHSTMFQSNV